MPAIVTLTFNPAIDKSTTVEALVPDKKLKCSTPRFEPGGGGVNVARAIYKLGGEALAVYPAGGHTGSFFNELLLEEGVQTIPIPIRQPTRENLVVIDNTAHKQYRFGMPGPLLADNEWRDLLQVIESLPEMRYLVASGSLPAGVPPDIFAQLAVIARQKDARYIADTSGEALQEVVKAGLYLLKPNLGELAALCGKEWLTETEASEAARELILQGHCSIVVVSLGEAGALLVTKDRVSIIRPPLVERKSTVGAGDSMVAGIVYSLAAEKDILSAVQYAVACGTAATMNPGTELCRKEDVETLFSRIIEEGSF
jgi:6-phosphofructokinase 2